MSSRVSRISSAISTVSTPDSLDRSKPTSSSKFIFFKLCNLLLYSFLWAISLTGLFGSFYFRVNVPYLHETSEALEKVMFPTLLLHKIGHSQITIILSVSVLYVVIATFGFIVTMKENFVMLGAISCLGFGCLVTEMVYLDIDIIDGGELWELLVEDAMYAKHNAVNMSYVEEILGCCWGENVGYGKPVQAECVDCIEVLWLYIADKNELCMYFIFTSIASQSLMSFFLLCLISFRPPKVYTDQDENQEITGSLQKRSQN